MPHTELLSRLAQLAGQVAHESEMKISRRGFLAAAASTAMLRAQAPGSVVIVGAGLAGLTCAYRLKQAGVQAAIFEAGTRAGGRCWSLRGAFDEGQLVERGGELIDQGHKQIRQLAQELGLTLDNLLAAEPNGSEPFYRFDGAPYTYAEATADLKGIWQKIHRDVSEAGYPTTYYLSTERGRQLDRMSIVDWINESVPGGMSSALGQLLEVAYNIEYGAEAGDQSALNLLYLLGYSGQGQLRIFGPSNEKYHVRGGNDQIAEGLAQAVAGQIQYGQALTAVKRNLDGRYTLTFRGGSRSTQVTADRVVLALPFSILRAAVDVREAGFRPLKITAIQQQGMGANSKFHMQFRNRRWIGLGCNGDTYSDSGYQNTWEVTRGQSGQSGILVNYTGGDAARAANKTTAAQVLAQLNQVLPGVAAQFNGKTQLEYWPGNPLTRGSYSFWKPGQYTSFAGVEGEAEGGCHFCGEHTSLDFQGYLNGAVETGERAAREVLAGS
jgi:monoamine oxidase